MRRVLLFAAFLLLLGLTTATAASFDVQAEDITSFSTSTTIVTPPPPPPPGAIVYYLRGQPATQPGVLDPAPDPDTSDPVRSKRLLPRLKSLQEEDDPDRYHVFEAGAASITVAAARAAVYINGGSGRIMVGLLECPPLAATSSNVASGCVLFAEGVVVSSGTGEQSVSLAPAATRTIPATNRLRMKVLNDNPVNPQNSNGTEFNVQWGYKSNRPSRLEVFAT